MKRHRKGGSSSKRFARRTEGQRKEFLRRVAGHIEEEFKGYILEGLFFGGNRLILKPLLQECPYLGARAGLVSSRIINVRYADREALLGSIGEINKHLAFV